MNSVTNAEAIAPQSYLQFMFWGAGLCAVTRVIEFDSP